jgi:PAS domain S-box-containing protein
MTGGDNEPAVGDAAGVTDRMTAETALRQSEEKYRALFNAIDQGFCIIKMLFDQNREAIDYRFLEANPVFEAQTGLADPIGRTALELVPQLERWWIDTYAAVAATGESVRFEHDAQQMGRVFDVFATRVGDKDNAQVAILFRDVTARRRAEEALHQSEARKAFLLALTDAIRPVADPEKISDVAMTLLSNHLGANRVVYFVVEQPDYVVAGQHSADVPRLGGRYPIAMFGDDLFRSMSDGHILVSNDIHESGFTAHQVAAFTHLQLRSYLVIPLVKEGTFVGGLTVHFSMPHVWKNDEIKLVEDVAERTWAAVERARAFAALTSSEHRFRSLAEGIPQLVWRSRGEGSWTWASPQWTAFTGQSQAESLGWGWLDKVHPDDRGAARGAWERAQQTGLLEVDYRLQEQRYGRFRWFQTRALPVSNPYGEVVEWLGTSTDVQELREMQERLTALVAELQHRTRNLMAVVSAVTDRTLSSCTSLDEFRISIHSRLGSIARASGLLSRLEGDARIIFDELLRMAFQGHGIDPADRTGQVTLEGPHGIRLRSSAVQLLALALHELAGQALRHGALSMPEGRLRIQWEMSQNAEGERHLAITWIETVRTGFHMTQAAELDRRFGQELIERALPYQLNARTLFSLHPDHLECRILLPLSP